MAFYRALCHQCNEEIELVARRTTVPIEARAFCQPCANLSFDEVRRLAADLRASIRERNLKGNELFSAERQLRELRQQLAKDSQ